MASPRPPRRSSIVGSSSSLERDHSREKSPSSRECAVCLQSWVHPVQLDCSHVFCYLCVKGVALQSRRCPMCRGDIAPTFLENPTLLEPLDSGLVGHHRAEDDALVAQLPPGPDRRSHRSTVPSVDEEDKVLTESAWYYEGRNGWWQYDARTSQELETLYQGGQSTGELLIAGFLYTIDLRSMVQFRRNEPTRQRQIKRDLVTMPKKGVAGLRVVPCSNRLGSSSLDTRTTSASGSDLTSVRASQSLRLGRDDPRMSPPHPQDLADELGDRELDDSVSSSSDETHWYHQMEALNVLAAEEHTDSEDD